MSLTDKELYLYIIHRHQQSHLGGPPYKPVDKSCPTCHPPLEYLHQQTQYFLNILNTYNQVVSYTSYTETYLAKFNNYLVFPHIDYIEGAKLAKRIVYTICFKDPVRIGLTYKFIFLYAHTTETFSKDPFSV